MAENEDGIGAIKWRVAKTNAPRRARVRRNSVHWGFVAPVVCLAIVSLALGVAGAIWRRADPRSDGALMLFIGGSVGFVLFTPFCLGALHMVWEHARLVRRGAWATARVQRVERGVDTSTEHIHSYQRVHYAFFAREGEVTGVWGAYESEELRALKDSETFAVLYDPRRPKRHLPYSVAMFEAAEQDGGRPVSPL